MDMISESIKKNRLIGYNILINKFEPFLRKFIIFKIFSTADGTDWKKMVPKGVFVDLQKRNDEIDIDTIDTDTFVEELTFLHLKDILIYSSNFKRAKSLFGNISKQSFIDHMDYLNRLRRKIAHAKSTFTNLDLLNLIDTIRTLCQGKDGKEIKEYLKRREYETEDLAIPKDFFEEYYCINNLPPENYDLDGGFVGREKEITTIMNYIKSEEDRIITISGAGGVGKTALALKVSYLFLYSQDNPFDAILWFSAKTSKLTDTGIIPLIPDIKGAKQLAEEILEHIANEKLLELKKKKASLGEYIELVYTLLKSNKCLLIIDNLETIIENEEIINFIKNIPRPSQVLITSRRGLGEIERRYPLKDMNENDAIHLFKLIAIERNLTELTAISTSRIRELVRRVRCYPLLIKWSIGQYSLGKELEESFTEIFSGESEIAKFSFNDVFNLLSENSKLVLYCMIVAGDKPTSKYVLKHLSNLDDDGIEDALRELTITSLIYSVNQERENRIVTEYNMLELTRGFVQSKLDENKIILESLTTRYYDLSAQIKDLEKSKSSFSQSLISLGIKSPDEQVAFIYVKTAKNYEYKGDEKNAEKNYKEAVKIAPNLAYVYTEYSKFEFNRKHYPFAEELARKAVEVAPESFHTWFNLGIILRKLHKYNAAIESLEKAKELNPTYLPIYSELGRVYSSNGEYEKAEIEFQKALKKEKYPNYRHQTITYQFMGENYRRWAQKFKDRRDIDGQINKLYEAKECIEKAKENSMGDWRIWKVYRKILIDLGIAFCQNKKYIEGFKFFEMAIAPIENFGRVFTPTSEELSITYFYMAIYRRKQAGKDDSKAEEYLMLAFKYCPPDSKWEERIRKLMNESSQKLIGKIKYYDDRRKFGIIETENSTYLFFELKNNNKTIDPKKQLGELVSFRLRKNQKDKNGRNPFIATDVKLYSENKLKKDTQKSKKSKH